MIDIAVSDLLGEEPSTAAKELMAAVEGVQSAVIRKSSEWLITWLRTYLSQGGRYVPPDGLIRPFLSDRRTTPTFFIPLFVYNAGAKHGEICSVVMTAELVSDRERRWAYAAYCEIDESKLIHLNQSTRDMDKISGIFSGSIIKPSDSAKLNLNFIPIHEVRGVQISSTSLLPGIYDLRVVGVDRKNRRVFSTVLKGYPLEEDTLLYSFKQGHWIFRPRDDENILHLMETNLI